MKIVWVTRSFLDYRIPVYKAVDVLCGGNLHVIYSGDVVPARCQARLSDALADRAISLSGEFRLTGRQRDNASFANTGLRIPYQPGLLRRISDLKPDVVVSDGFFQWTYAPLILRAVRGIPHVMCYERTAHTERNAGLIRTAYRRLAQRFIDMVCCNGQLTIDYLKSLGCSAEKMRRGNMAADSLVLRKETEKLADGGEDGIYRFLYVGQLIARKGIRELLAAWKEFARNTEGCAELVLIGGGSQAEEIKTFIARESVSNVKVLGVIPYSELPTHYANAGIFIIPTLEDNWSLVVPEAMACGLPILCSKYNGCWPELVRKENGWVFDPLDPANFLNALREAWRKRDHWPQMGEESRKIEQDFSPERVAETIFSACRQAVGTM